jgi:chemotaxis protein CheZ
MSETKFAGDSAEVCSTMYQRIGMLTRTLHDTLSQLGLDRKLHEVASSLPDARTRLAYVSQLTGQAAERVLNAVDRAESVQRHVGELSEQVLTELESGQSQTFAPAQLVDYVSQVRTATDQTSEELREIMMAQDFHDLTGQVIGKIVTLAHQLESELVRVLLDAAPVRTAECAHGELQSGMNGPAMNAQYRDDVVQNQTQVDDLLESLGF